MQRTIVGVNRLPHFVSTLFACILNVFSAPIQFPAQRLPDESAPDACTVPLSDVLQVSRDSYK